MPPEKQQLFKEQIAQLPPDVQAAVLSTDLVKKLQAIGTAHGLHIDQMGALENEAFFVMLGLVEPASFPSMLAKNLAISPDDAGKISMDVNNQIFMPIRESMMKMNSPMTSTPAAPAAMNIAPQIHPADIALSQPTVTPAPKIPIDSKSAETVAVKKTPITDPYREPIE